MKVVITLFALIALCAARSVMNDSKPTPREMGYTLFPKTGYYKFHKPATWQDANNICQNEGAHLAIVDTYEEAGIIAALAKNSPKDKFKYNDHVLLGFHDMQTEGVFITIKGDPLNTDVMKWGKKRPNGGRNENCGAVQNGRYNDIFCNTLQHFICEIEI